MLVQFTPVNSLPFDVRSRLTAQLAAQPLMMSNEPMLFEGYHLSATEVHLAQRIAKNQQASPGQPLFG